MIHAGGKGERLKPITLRIPKPLIQVGLDSQPLIYWSMQPAINAGIKRFVITTNYLSEEIEKYFKNKKWFGLDITIFKEPKPLGSAGAAKFCIEQGMIRENPVLMQNAVDITRNIIPDLIKNHEEQVKKYGYEATIVVAKKCVIPSSRVKFNPDTKTVYSLDRKPKHVWQDGEGSHVGMFLFEPKAMKRFESVAIPSSPEDSVAQDIIKERKAGIFLTDSWMPIKYTSDIDEANKIDIEKFQKQL